MAVEVFQVPERGSDISTGSSAKSEFIPKRALTSSHRIVMMGQDMILPEHNAIRLQQKRKKMIKSIATALAFAAVATSAVAESHVTGDASAGETAFKKCVTCHVVVDDEGNLLAGKKAKTGPNLYGVIGRQAGIVEGFRYGKSIVEAGEAGLIWEQDEFAAYVQDPKKFLQEFLDNKKARSKMSYKVRGEEDAINLAAFLASFSPVVESTEEAGEEIEENATETDQ